MILQKNLRSITQGKNIPVIVDYWSVQVAKKLHKQFDLITGTNVFAHVDDLDKFLEAVRVALKDSGIVILEFPYANKMIEHNEFDTIYHEHLSYFLVHSFATLIERMGFHIVDILQTKIHGGSIRFFLQKGKKKHTSKVKKLIAKENADGLLNLTTYRLFAKRVAENKKNLLLLVQQEREKGKKVIGYGASAKGNTMLNYTKVTVDYIVDDNNLKWNLFTPGQNIPIHSPHILSSETKDLSIVVLSWNFYNEIMRKVLQIRKNKSDNLITYVPTVICKPVGETIGVSA